MLTIPARGQGLLTWESAKQATPDVAGACGSEGGTPTNPPPLQGHRLVKEAANAHWAFARLIMRGGAQSCPLRTAAPLRQSSRLSLLAGAKPCGLALRPLTTLWSRKPHRIPRMGEGQVPLMCQSDGRCGGDGKRFGGGYAEVRLKAA